MTNLFTKIFNPRYEETLEQSEARMHKLNNLFCESWNFLSGHRVDDDDLPRIHWIANKDGSVTFNWVGEKYASYEYTITRSKVICTEFPNENLDIDYTNNFGEAMVHLHVVATQACDDVWPFVLTEAERTALNNRIGRIINAGLREKGLDFEALAVDDDKEDLTDTDVDSIREMVGGKESYNELIEWAADRLPKREIEAFDEVVSQGNTEEIKVSVRGLMQQRLDAQAVGQA